MLQSHWLDILLTVGSAQGVFISVVLWQKQLSNRQAIRYLVLLIGMMSAIMLMRATYQPGFFQKFVEIIMLPDAILFLIGPFLYFFVRSLLQLPLPGKPRRYWHYLPAILHMPFLNIILALNYYKVWSFLENWHVQWGFFLIEGGAITSLGIYLWLGFMDVRKYREAWERQFSTPFPARFLRPFFGVGFLFVAAWAVSFLHNLTLDTPNYLVYAIMWFLLVGYVFYLGYQVMLKPEVLELPSLRVFVEMPVSTQEKVERYMREHKPFLEPELKIGYLAQALGMPKHELSRVLNHAFGQNFFDYLNAWRIREFIALRKDPRNTHLNISDLAFQSGFNSRTAFNRAFRKETGRTPSEYFQNLPLHKPELS
ncbi:MAG: AraC family transcriptional regulator [Lewinellaceae bacterium]|nr:AraC family transcriptional regulator [Saprospiraceae bacterium]MCB9341226.1 AraC family transcriptional regulator [Lewinellaceae bacterium]